jgi:hypothetical protein
MLVQAGAQMNVLISVCDTTTLPQPGYGYARCSCTVGLA